MNKSAFNKFCKLLVAKFVKSDKISWPKEIKIAQKLLKIKEDGDFWINLHSDLKITSLAWFLTKEGKAFLVTQERINSLELSPKETHLIQDEKLGEDLNLKKKPKTVFDFLNYGKK